MAKDKLTNLFAKTEPSQDPETTPGQPLAMPEDTRKKRKRDATDPIKSYGVGLRASQWVKFFTIAADLGTNYHDLAVYVLTDFIARWERGERPPTETKQVLKRP